MSLTTGIHRCKKATPFGPILEDVSWKNRTFDMWITEYLFLYFQDPPPVLQINDDGQFFIVSSSLLTRIAQDLLNENFQICSAGEWFVDASDYVYAKEYGHAFLKMCHNLEPDEILVYYDCGC